MCVTEDIQEPDYVADDNTNTGESKRHSQDYGDYCGGINTWNN